jgi:peptide-methionine (R)-S-oxide reductase
MIRLMVKPIAFMITATVVLLPRGCELNTSGPNTAIEETKDVNDQPVTNKTLSPDSTGKVVKTNAEWRKLLTDQQYNILRRKGTERAFTGGYDHFFEKGVYLCAACGGQLFTSDTKYDSGCGWPAFTQPADADTVHYSRDTSHGTIRTEVTCSRCGGHLGHVFDDGPAPAGKRYCINSAALKFQKKDK